LVWFVDDEDEEVSGLMDPDSLDPGSVSRVHSGRRKMSLLVVVSVGKLSVGLVCR